MMISDGELVARLLHMLMEKHRRQSEAVNLRSRDLLLIKRCMRTAQLIAI
jgi:hypothetical protein